MKRDLEFLYEMGALRLMPRQWTRFHFPHVQNQAEHHFRVVWIALIIAACEKQKVDTEKILKMALIHDVAESRTGDVDYISRQYATRHGEMAINDILEGTSIRKDFLDAWAEYESRESLEAKIVKDADNLDVDMELREQAVNGSHVEAVKTATRQRVREEKLYTKTAKTLFDEIKRSDPHDWYILAPNNRLNGGDWKKEEAKEKSGRKKKQL